MDTEEKIEVMQAWLEGNDIEVRVKDEPRSDWANCPSPFWDWRTYDYRVKKGPREMWVAYGNGGDIIHLSPYPINVPPTLGEVVHYREVEN